MSLPDPTIVSLKKRFLALFLDFLLIIGYALVLFVLSMFIYLVPLGGVPMFNESGMNLLSLALIIPSALYCIIMECTTKHATVGKRAARIKVASTRLGRLRVWQVIVRNIIKFLPWQLAHMAIIHGVATGWDSDMFTTVVLYTASALALLWVGSLFGRKHRGIHDHIAGTIVVPSTFLPKEERAYQRNKTCYHKQPKERG